MPGQRQEAGLTVGVTAPTGLVRGLFRARPWPDPPPGLQVSPVASFRRRSRLRSSASWLISICLPRLVVAAGCWRAVGRPQCGDPGADRVSRLVIVASHLNGVRSGQCG
jgi:hypothetical protein